MHKAGSLPPETRTLLDGCTVDRRRRLFRGSASETGELSCAHDEPTGTHNRAKLPHQIALGAAMKGRPKPTDTLSGVFQPHRLRLMQAVRIASHPPMGADLPVPAAIPVRRSAPGTERRSSSSRPSKSRSAPVRTGANRAPRSPIVLASKHVSDGYSSYAYTSRTWRQCRLGSRADGCCA